MSFLQRVYFIICLGFGLQLTHAMELPASHIEKIASQAGVTVACSSLSTPVLAVVGLTAALGDNESLSIDHSLGGGMGYALGEMLNKTESNTTLKAVYCAILSACSLSTQSMPNLICSAMGHALTIELIKDCIIQAIKQGKQFVIRIQEKDLEKVTDPQLKEILRKSQLTGFDLIITPYALVASALFAPALLTCSILPTALCKHLQSHYFINACTIAQSALYETMYRGSKQLLNSISSLWASKANNQK